MRRYYYDMRFLLLPALALLRSYYARTAGEEQSMSSSFAMKLGEMVFFSSLLAAFLLATIRIQLFAGANGRRLELRCGRSALSVPLTLSLIMTLFVPLSSLVNVYLVILVMSMWSDPIHHFIITRFSYADERQLLLLRVTLAHTTSTSPPNDSWWPTLVLRRLQSSIT